MYINLYMCMFVCVIIDVCNGDIYIIWSHAKLETETINRLLTCFARCDLLYFHFWVLFVQNFYS